MTVLPVWLLGLLGGLALGPLSLIILWPACSRGVTALLKRLVITFLIKLLLAGVSLYVAIKHLHLPAQELIFGFFAGYFISLILEISLCIRKVRKCAANISSS